jgi:hypothetical protein
MTAIVRNTLLAFAAISALAGSAMAEQKATKMECGTTTSQEWTGRCCGLGGNACLGGGGNNNGGHGGRGGSER